MHPTLRHIEANTLEYISDELERAEYLEAEGHRAVERNDPKAREWFREATRRRAEAVRLMKRDAARK